MWALAKSRYRLAALREQLHNIDRPAFDALVQEVVETVCRESALSLMRANHPFMLKTLDKVAEAR